MVGKRIVQFLHHPVAEVVTELVEVHSKPPGCDRSFREPQ